MMPRAISSTPIGACILGTTSSPSIRRPWATKTTPAPSMPTMMAMPTTAGKVSTCLWLNSASWRTSTTRRTKPSSPATASSKTWQKLCSTISFRRWSASLATFPSRRPATLASRATPMRRVLPTMTMWISIAPCSPAWASSIATSLRFSRASTHSCPNHWSARTSSMVATSPSGRPLPTHCACALPSMWLLRAISPLRPVPPSRNASPVTSSLPTTSPLR